MLLIIELGILMPEVLLLDWGVLFDGAEPPLFLLLSKVQLGSHLIRQRSIPKDTSEHSCKYDGHRNHRGQPKP